jgi:hypothetical protein
MSHTTKRTKHKRYPAPECTCMKQNTTENNELEWRIAHQRISRRALYEKPGQETREEKELSAATDVWIEPFCRVPGDPSASEPSFVAPLIGGFGLERSHSDDSQLAQCCVRQQETNASCVPSSSNISIHSQAQMNLSAPRRTGA